MMLKRLLLGIITIIFIVLSLFTACASVSTTTPVPILSSIEITPTSPASLVVGSTQRFVAVGTYADGSTTDISSQVTWNSDPNVVTISFTGVAKGIAAGTAKITAAMSGVTSPPVTLVIVPKLSSITITPISPVDLAVGSTKQFTAVGTYSDGSTSDISSQVIWNSDPNVATISFGLATGITTGTANITASMSGITSSPVTVNIIPVISLPPGWCAFWGKVFWGELPAVNASVIADTKNPAIVLLPWVSDSDKYKQFTALTNNNGEYILYVTPERYYIGSSLSGSDYVTYTTFLNTGLLGAYSKEIKEGDIVHLDLKTNDWSVQLISPGNIYSLFKQSQSVSTLDSNNLKFEWQEYDWNKYNGEKGYYKIEIGIIKDGYHTVVTGESNNPYYINRKSLESGEYEWTIRVYSSNGKEIAGNKVDYYFNVQ